MDIWRRRSYNRYDLIHCFARFIIILKGSQLSDLWRYSVNDTIWTWMSGSDGTSNSYFATYGLQGIESSTVMPGGRRMPGFFYNASAGVFYIHGGMVL